MYYARSLSFQWPIIISRHVPSHLLHSLSCSGEIFPPFVTETTTIWGRIVQMWAWEINFQACITANVFKYIKCIFSSHCVIWICIVTAFYVCCFSNLFRNSSALNEQLEHICCHCKDECLFRAFVGWLDKKMFTDKMPLLC